MLGVLGTRPRVTTTLTKRPRVNNRYMCDEKDLFIWQVEVSNLLGNLLGCSWKFVN